MYAFIRGTVEDISSDGVVVEAGGVGYLLICSSATMQALKIGETTKVYTYQAVREDAITLYGFLQKEERRMFLRLISVGGIGPKVSLQILSAISLRELALALVTGDTSALTRVPGVGKKTAQRLILELKEKVDNDELIGGTDVASAGGSSNAADAIMALTALGYPASEAARAVNAVAGTANSVEEIIRLTLKSMDRR